MRTTIILDQSLVDKAKRLTGISKKTKLLHEGLQALIERESARQLADLGGSEPDLEPTPRRRSRKTRR